MIFLKKNISIILRKFLYLFSLDKLNINEKSGYFSLLTRLKFLKTSHHDLPFDNGLTIRGVSFSEFQNDSWGRAIYKSGKNMESSDRFITEVIENISKEQIKKAGDFFNLASNHKLNSVPLWALVLPWEKVSLSYQLKNYAKLLLQNRQEHNIFQFHNRLNMPLNQNDLEKFAHSHFNQFLNIYKSISQKGFIKNNDRPRAFILVNGKKWKWIMSGQGNHRALISKSLGYKQLPCEVRGRINKSNSGNWHNVKNNLYTKEEAEHIFDLFFMGTDNRRGMI
jgi:hypothetical protein